MSARKKTAQRTAGTDSGELDAKISDKRLKSFAAGDSSRPRTVLIRLDIPEPRLTIGKHRRIGQTSLPRRSLTLSDAQRKEREQKTLEFLRDLEQSGIENNPLSSGTVIAKVYPDQLRHIARSELTKAIIPNRKYRIG